MEAEGSTNIYHKQIAINQLVSKLSEHGKLSKKVMHPVDKTETTLARLMEVVQKQPPLNTTLVKLDKYVVQHPIPAGCLATVLLNISARITRDNLGIESITWALSRADTPVSYTHLTLPTICSV